MSFIKEWKWNRSQTGGYGVLLHNDHLVWYYENWAAPFTDIGSDQSLEDFLTQGARDKSIPSEMLEELYTAVRQIVTERDES